MGKAALRAYREGAAERKAGCCWCLADYLSDAELYVGAKVAPAPPPLPLLPVEIKEWLDGAAQRRADEASAFREQFLDLARASAARPRTQAKRATSPAHKYELASEEYEAMCLEQKGLCYICSRPPKHVLVVDHCHATGRIRKLLCSRCNTALGFMEKGGLLEKMLAYLDEHKA